MFCSRSLQGFSIQTPFHNLIHFSNHPFTIWYCNLFPRQIIVPVKWFRCFTSSVSQWKICLQAIPIIQGRKPFDSPSLNKEKKSHNFAWNIYLMYLLQFSYRHKLKSTLPFKGCVRVKTVHQSSDAKN